VTPEQMDAHIKEISEIFNEALNDAFIAVDYGVQMIDEHTDGPATMRYVLSVITEKITRMDVEQDITAGFMRYMLRRILNDEREVASRSAERLNKIQRQGASDAFDKGWWAHEQYAICAAEFPDLADAYEALYQDEKRAFVEKFMALLKAPPPPDWMTA